MSDLLRMLETADGRRLLAVSCGYGSTAVPEGLSPMLGELLVDDAMTVVRLHGDLDLVTVEGLRELLAQAGATRPRELVVDLSDAPFVDVLSLSAILATADGLRDRGGQLMVVGASASVRRVCALLNAEDVLAPLVPTPRVAAR